MNHPLKAVSVSDAWNWVRQCVPFKASCYSRTLEGMHSAVTGLYWVRWNGTTLLVRCPCGRTYAGILSSYKHVGEPLMPGGIEKILSELSLLADATATYDELIDLRTDPSMLPEVSRLLRVSP